MSRTTLAWALALGTALATPALAQTDTKTTQPEQAQPAAPATTTTAQPAASGKFLMQAQEGQWRTSKMVGVDIYNNNDENIGEVNELVLDNSGAIQAVVIGVGGFLGIGEKNVGLPFNAVKWMDKPRPSASMATNTAPPVAPATPGAPAAGGGNMAATPDATGAIVPTVRDYPDHGILNMTKDELNAAPEFKFASETK